MNNMLVFTVNHLHKIMLTTNALILFIDVYRRGQAKDKKVVFIFFNFRPLSGDNKRHIRGVQPASQKQTIKRV